MIDRDPGLTINPIDEFLSNETKQQAVRDFFSDTDRQYAGFLNSGNTLNTVGNAPLHHYPAIITQDGLVLEAAQLEQKSSGIPEHVIRQYGSAITTGELDVDFLHQKLLNPILFALCVDLLRPNQESVALMPVVDDLNNVAENWRHSSQTFERGGTMVMFGYKDDAVTKEYTPIKPEIDEALRQADAGDTTLLQNLTSRLRNEGAYLLVLEFKRFADESGKSATSLSSKFQHSEHLIEARKRNGFSL